MNSSEAIIMRRHHTRRDDPPKVSLRTRVIQVMIVMAVLAGLLSWQWWAAKDRSGMHFVTAQQGDAPALVNGRELPTSRSRS